MFTYIDNLERMHASLFTLLKKSHFETYEHSKRCARHMTELAIYFNFNKAKRERLIQAAFFHDIGKIFLPIDILDKKGKLTPKEFELISKHAIMGGCFLEKEKCLDSDIIHLIKKHHCVNENQSEDILILAMIDIYDALKYPRVYKPSFSHEKTFDILFDKFRDLEGMYIYLDYLKQMDLNVL